MKISLLLLANRLHKAFNRLLLGREKFCTECSGPYSSKWLRQYGGHWDTCPNRRN